VAVSLATFMTYLDNNIINVAIPTIQHSLHLDQAGIEWVVSAYILTFAGLLLAGGRLADVFGRRRVFAAGLVVFTLASLAAGMSNSLGLLVAGRAVQGIGAALVTPSTMALVAAAFPEPREQARAVGAYSAVGALALALGPLLGGILAADANWHWIFFINVPVGVVTLATVMLATDAEIVPSRRERRQVDLPGITWSVLALGGLTFGLIEGPQIGWGRSLVIAAVALAGVAAAAFARVEKRRSDPMLDLRVFADRAFSGGVVAIMLWAFGLFGIYFFTSLYLQDLLHFGAVEAGAAFVPMAVLMAAGAAVSDRVAARIGAHRSVGWAMALMGAGIASVSLFGRTATFLELMPGLAVIGIGGGLTIPLTSTIVAALPADRAGVASAVFNASREVAGLMGVTLLGVIISARSSALAHTGHDPATAFLGGYRLALLIAGALVASGGLVAWRSLRQPAGSGSPAREPQPAGVPGLRLEGSAA
jgi:EmrB/QacA subfamily drug resistance transporter